MHPSQTVLWIGVAYVTSEKISIKDASRLPFVSFARGGFHSRKTAAISKYRGYKPTMESGVAYLGKSRTSLKRCSGYRGMRSST